MIFVTRVHTDAGITGYACMEAPHGILQIVCQTMEYAKSQIVGDSPFDIEKIMLKLRNIARIATRPWVVENACWDILGKAAGLPVYKLLGACHDRIPVYAAWGEIRSNDQRKEDAKHLFEAGFRAVKLRFSSEKLRDDIAIVKAVRDAAGDKLEIMVDAKQGTACERNHNGFPPVWSYDRARETAREMEKLHCTWLEEPLWRYDFDGLARLCSEVDIPIAGGEINIGIPDFKIMLEKRSYDILQPNCTMSTGISYIRNIAALAESCGKIVNSHAYIYGTGVLQSMHLVASYTNFTYLEYPYDPPTLTPPAFQGIVRHNFAGAAASLDVKSIVVLKTVTKNGKFSKITPFFKAGTPVNLPRTVIEYVVTEHGIATLVVKTPSERTRELIAVAHPRFREELTFEARKLGML